MRRLAFLLLLLLLSTLCWSQSAVPLGVEARISPARTTVDLRDGQFTNRTDQTRIELSALALIERFRIKYALVPGFQNAVVVTPVASFLVGTTEFGKDPTQQGQTGTNEQTPVSLDWRHDTAHRIEASYFWSYPVRPLVIAEWIGCTLTATGEKDGKQTTDTETFRRGVIGLGALYQIEPSRLMRVNVQAVSGKGFTRAEGAVMWGLNETTALSLGYAIQSVQFDGLRLNEQGGWLGATVAF